MEAGAAGADDRGIEEPLRVGGPAERVGDLRERMEGERLASGLAMAGEGVKGGAQSTPR